MAKPIDVSKYFTMLKPCEVKPGYYMLSSASLRAQLELAYQEGICEGNAKDKAFIAELKQDVDKMVDGFNK